MVNYSEFSNIEEFHFQTPEEKKGALLNQLNIVNDETYILDIQLYTDDASIPELYAKVENFKEFLESIETTVLDDCILQHLVILKINIKGENINRLLEHNNVYFADCPQKSIYDINEINNLAIDELPSTTPPSATAPLVAIIDSGILPGHPLLQGSVAESLPFGELPHPFDENGHGTMVAGIVQFGDVFQTIQKHKEFNTPIPLPFRLLNGRVTNQDNVFPDSKIVAAVVKEAIEEFAQDAYNCKIFNLSLGDDRTPYLPGTKMDYWSYMLDKLNHEYNLAIVVSSGNYFPDNNVEVLKYYTDYLLTDPGQH